MIYRLLAGERVSWLGLGGMRLPTRGLLRSIDEARATEMVCRAYELGIRYFDTAWFYHLGHSETFLGSVLSRFDRESWSIATKYYFPGFPNVRKVFEAQLRRVKVSYFDFYLLHSLRDAYVDHYFLKGRLEYLLAQQCAGRIKHLGFSSHLSPSKLEQVASMRSWDFAQIQLNYYDWYFGTAREEYEILRAYNIPIVVMEPLRGGTLAQLTSQAEVPLRALHPSWEPYEWAFRWLHGLEGIKVILSGMSTRSQVENNVAIFEREQPLTAHEQSALAQSCGAMHEYLAAPCTACGYCKELCPEKLDIPRIMDAYNEWHAQGISPEHDVQRAIDACRTCGACAPRCPQSIAIPELIAQLRHPQRIA